MFAVFSSLIRVTRSVASSSYPYLKEHDSGFGGVHPSSNSKLSFVILCRKASSLRIDCRNGLITCTYSREDSQWMLDTMQKDNSSLTCHWWNAESLHRTRLTELCSPPHNLVKTCQILVKFWSKHGQIRPFPRIFNSLHRPLVPRKSTDYRCFGAHAGMINTHVSSLH
jgi:hypothetical protein